jgi:hypothetical protein
MAWDGRHAFVRRRGNMPMASSASGVEGTGSGIADHTRMARGPCGLRLAVRQTTLLPATPLLSSLRGFLIYPYVVSEHLVRPANCIQHYRRARSGLAEAQR